MTEPPKKSAEKPNTFRDHIPAIAGSLCGTALSIYLGSFFGTTGTLYGTLLGSAASNSVSWWGERAIRKSAAVAKAKREAVKRRNGAPLSDAETRTIEAYVEKTHRRNWKPILLSVVGIIVVCAGGLTAVEAIIGHPVANAHGAGTTFGGSRQLPSTDPATPISSLAPTQSLTPTPSPDITPDEAPSISSTPTPTPTIDPSPSLSPSPIPSVDGSP